MTSIFKIMLLGDTSTAKTSFLTQLIYQVPEELPKSTTDLSFFTLRISNPIAAIVQIWDSPGDPKHHYKAISMLADFNAALIFVDVTNQHTLQRAVAFIDQISIFKQLSIHLIETKLEITEKTPYKRKVCSKKLIKLAESVGGNMFAYRKDQPVEQIVQHIVAWKEKGQTQKEQKYTKQLIPQAEVEFQVAEPEYFCDCSVY